MGDFFDKGFWQGLATSVVYSALCWLAVLAKTSISKRNPKNSLVWNQVYVGFVFVLWVGVNLVVFLFCPPSYYLISLVLTGFITWLLVWREISQFLAVGIIRADREIGKGFGYDAALKLCRNEIDFLGIGASKLTGSAEFEPAVRRCHRETTPVRFLLAHPENPLLVDAAQRLGVDPAEYKRRVSDSLAVLAKLKTVNKLNIEVRFYRQKRRSDFPLFRLMFVNDSICLFSYNVFGEGDGSQLPQLHLNRPEKTRDTNSFYYPLKQFFDRLWEESKPWDFQFPVKP